MFIGSEICQDKAYSSATLQTTERNSERSGGSVSQTAPPKNGREKSRINPIV
jgi:hypothetical protein